MDKETTIERKFKEMARKIFYSKMLIAVLLGIDGIGLVWLLWNVWTASLAV